MKRSYLYTLGLVVLLSCNNEGTKIADDNSHVDAATTATDSVDSSTAASSAPDSMAHTDGKQSLKIIIRGVGLWNTEEQQVAFSLDGINKRLNQDEARDFRIAGDSTSLRFEDENSIWILKKYGRYALSRSSQGWWQVEDMDQ